MFDDLIRRMMGKRPRREIPLAESSIRQLMENIPRSYFIKSEESRESEGSICFYIGKNTTRETGSLEVIRQFIELLELNKTDNVMVIGSKGGYLEFLCAAQCNDVYIVDANEEVVEITTQNIARGTALVERKLKRKVYGITVIHKDNPLEGMPEIGRWDRILIAAAAILVPSPPTTSW